ncbi:hypothetical protein GCM10009037_11760 [Halarchaeum grantii]|uniref:Uncharacterized protein n=1 Tax=Halarchaeum grantii TaxID=1193105 RepID=A0A830F191_9EURY|nr:hypothetical protein GCM10009037_11760 [Halarchaeum grantii]
MWVAVAGGVLSEIATPYPRYWHEWCVLWQYWHDGSPTAHRPTLSPALLARVVCLPAASLTPVGATGAPPALLALVVCGDCAAFATLSRPVGYS